MNADERITLRMGTEEVQAMDEYLDEHPELGNRSQFIRTAVREYVNRDADVAPLSDKEGEGLFIRFTETELGAINLLVENGVYLSGEEFVRTAMKDLFAPRDVREESIRNAFAVSASEALKK